MGCIQGDFLQIKQYLRKMQFTARFKGQRTFAIPSFLFHPLLVPVIHLIEVVLEETLHYQLKLPLDIEYT